MEAIFMYIALCPLRNVQTRYASEFQDVMDNVKTTTKYNNIIHPEDR